jgi:5-carboxymethyl-2-hydroxymuconate isomerase
LDYGIGVIMDYNIDNKENFKKNTEIYGLLKALENAMNRGDKFAVSSIYSRLKQFEEIKDIITKMQ